MASQVDLQRRLELLLVAFALIACGSGAAAQPQSRSLAMPEATAQAAAPAAGTEAGSAAAAPATEGPAPAPSPPPEPTRSAPRSMVETTVSVPGPYRTGPLAETRRLQISEGFAIAVYGRVAGARSLAVAPWGEVLVTQPGQGRIMALRDGNGDGAADEARALAQGLQCPYGMVVRDGFLYVAQSTKVERFRVDDAGHIGGAEAVVSGLPASGCGAHHFRPLAIDAAGNLYVAFGSSCNVCVEPDRRRGTVWQYAPDGTGREYARGLRNVVDLQFDPSTGQLWAATNERDALGDDIPADPVLPIQEGANYGWPFCYWNGAGWTVDPRVPAQNPSCAGLTPYNGIQAHSAPLGLTIGSGQQLPPDYQGHVFVGLHGSWNRSTGTGFKVVRIPVEGGAPQPAEDFVTGWLTGSRGPQDAWGRPVDVKVALDGSLLVSDDVAGAIYRITTTG